MLRRRLWLYTNVVSNSIVLDDQACTGPGNASAVLLVLEGRAWPHTLPYFDSDMRTCDWHWRRVVLTKTFSCFSKKMKPVASGQVRKRYRNYRIKKAQQEKNYRNMGGEESQ